jgi:hypothetical protein
MAASSPSRSLLSTTPGNPTRRKDGARGYCSVRAPTTSSTSSSSHQSSHVSTPTAATSRRPSSLPTRRFGLDHPREHARPELARVRVLSELRNGLPRWPKRRQANHPRDRATIALSGMERNTGRITQLIVQSDTSRDAAARDRGWASRLLCLSRRLAHTLAHTPLNPAHRARFWSSSKPAGRGSPTVGQFDSGAAPLPKYGRRLPRLEGRDVRRAASRDRHRPFDTDEQPRRPLSESARPPRAARAPSLSARPATSRADGGAGFQLPAARSSSSPTRPKPRQPPTNSRPRPKRSG